MTLTQRLDPRLHLSAAIGWAVFTLVTLAALVAANLAAVETGHRARADTERLLGQFSTQIQQTLAMSMQTRRSIVQATAAQIVASSDRGTDALRRHLEAVQAQFPEFTWLGVADDRGRVVAATDGLFYGEDVAARPWFQQGREHPYLGKVHDAQGIEDAPRRAVDGRPVRIVTVAVPLTQPEGRNVGVLGAHLSWAWVEKLQADLLLALDTRRQLELLLVAEDGTVLAGPADWLGRKLGADPSEAGAYVVGRNPANPAGEGGSGWTVIVRQGAAPALAAARTTRNAVFLVVLLAGLAAAAAAAVVTRMLTRRLAALAEGAEAVRRGARLTLTVPAGTDEVSRIGATLAEAVDHLQQEKQALLTLNAELDARVAERTARIERLADEARHAAVARERLRFARDLHDTLAHSLMALLTQLRLVRKFRDKMSEDEFGAELARAEEVAASGLAEARAAITQMRHGTVRENGLAAALRDLLGRFGERTGVEATLRVRGWAADLADERAETLYRIVEEALRNVERHAQARSVSVEIDDAPATGDDPGHVAVPRATLSVRDDGVGYDTAVPCPGHYGMLGMREQADLIGAELVVRSAPGQGMNVELRFAA